MAIIAKCQIWQHYQITSSSFTIYDSIYITHALMYFSKREANFSLRSTK